MKAGTLYNNVDIDVDDEMGLERAQEILDRDEARDDPAGAINAALAIITRYMEADEYLGEPGDERTKAARVIWETVARLPKLDHGLDVLARVTALTIVKSGEPFGEEAVQAFAMSMIDSLREIRRRTSPAPSIIMPSNPKLVN